MLSHQQNKLHYDGKVAEQAAYLDSTLHQLKIYSTSWTSIHKKLPIAVLYKNQNVLKHYSSLNPLLLPTDAHNVKKTQLLRHSKLDKNAPTCFGLHRNHLQGAKVSVWLKITRLVKSICVKDVQGVVNAMAAYCDL